MSTVLTAPEVVPALVAPSTATVRPSFLGILRGEWIKLLSLRSTWWTLGATVALVTGIPLAVAYSLDAMAADPTTTPGRARAQEHGGPGGATVVAGAGPSRWIGAVR